MELWGCNSEGNEYDLLSENDELDLAVEGCDALDGNVLFEFDLDSPFGLDEDLLFLDKQVMERFQEVESGLSDIIQKTNEISSNVENLGVGDGIFSGDDMNLASPDCGLSSFSLLGDTESWSSSFSAINLEMGRQEGDAENDNISKKRTEASVAPLSLPVEQGDSESLTSTKVTCQVQGCNADLTSSKDYYKRHRVCPLDTKKAEVIVNGIQKRFCQQCSRFHLLNEFDDDKRSCRKRLMGHNKRRRKPRFENCSHRPLRFQPYQGQGIRPHGAALPSRRQLLTDLFPARVLYPDIYEQINGSRIQGSSVHGLMPTNIPSLRNPCPGPEHYTPQVTPSTFQKSSGVLDASYALSLLSNQPQFSSHYFTMASPVIIQGHNIFHNQANKVSFSASPHMLHSSGMNMLPAYPIHPGTIPGTINPASSTVGNNHDGGSFCSNCSYCQMPRQQGSTVDLRQLSFNLSRVEHQRNIP